MRYRGEEIMEVIYTGKEKNLHLKLVERMMSEKHINAKDIAYIHFTNTHPNDKFPLWTLNIEVWVIDNGTIKTKKQVTNQSVTCFLYYTVLFLFFSFYNK